ncbi:MAG: DsbA family protein, partial [Bdellovibrionota bacterium]
MSSAARLRIPVTEADHSQGPKDAPLELVEYGDYQCPFCGQAYPVVKRLQKEFKEHLRFVFRNFPLAIAHPFAMDAARAA